MRDPELIEMLALQDIYADGIASVEPLSGRNFRVSYFVYQRVPTSNILTRVVVARLVRSRDSLVPGAITSMLDAWPTVGDQNGDGHG